MHELSGGFVIDGVYGDEAVQALKTILKKGNSLKTIDEKRSARPLHKVQETQMVMYNVKKERLAPLLKWAGGKENELKFIQPLIPSFDRFFEPFVGGGAVFFSLQASVSYINDKSTELMNLYKMIAGNDRAFFKMLETMVHHWERISDVVDLNPRELLGMYKPFSDNKYTSDKMKDVVLDFVLHHVDEFNGMFESSFNKNIENFIREITRNLMNKTSRMKVLESRKGRLSDLDILANIECALKSAYYMHFRYLYNHRQELEIPPSHAAAMFFFIRENAYASMFRYNSQGGFNVPYGGISYNRKGLKKKLDLMKSSDVRYHFSNTVIENMDFDEFLSKHQPGVADFMFLDPPYDSDFSTYSQNEFTKNDHERLAAYLLNKCPSKFMLVIKNTKFISQLYENKGLNIETFDKKYLVSFQDRNDKNAEHLIITNY